MIQRWITRERVSGPHLGLLAFYCELFEGGGPDALSGVIQPLDEQDGFFVMRVRPKGASAATPIFCYGPFDPETEITFVAGAPTENGILTARDVLPVARHNRAALTKDRLRRKLERIN